MKIIVNRNLCIGAAPCVAIAPEVFQLDDEGKAVVIDPHGTDDETIFLAAEACPVLAIFLYEDSEANEVSGAGSPAPSPKQIYPKVA